MKAVRPSSVFSASECHSTAARLPFGIAAGGALLAAFGAAPVQAQIYSPNLTTSTANPTIYFSMTAGTSSLTSFASATNTLNYVSGTSNVTAGSLSNQEGVALAGSVCGATRYNAGDSIDPTTANPTQGPASGNNLDPQQGWAYPGSGYLGIVYFPGGVNNGPTNFYGWASVTLLSDHNVKLNNFALQTVPGTSIAAGAAPIVVSAATPEPDAVALLALGASGLAALRLRRKATESANDALASTPAS